MGAKKQTVGYRYLMGLHFGLSHGPINEVAEIRVGGRTAWSGSQTASGQISVNNPNLFGGDDREGGIVGALDVMMGETTQVANTYLAAVAGAQQPTYRGLLTAVFRGGRVCSNNPYPKPWSFRLRRSSAGWDNNAPWYSAKAMVSFASGSIKAMNPAHIIYEVLTNRDWGMGYPTGTLDDTSFRAAADQLYTEGFGLCLLWTRQDSIENFLQQVIDYVGASLATDRTTGLFTLTLLRGGYNVSLLPAFDEDDVLDLVGLDGGTLAGAANEITVKYHDPVAHVDQSVTLQALGSIQAQGVVISDSRDYHGVPDYDLAARLAQRELRASSVPLKRLEVKFKRTAYKLKPGDVFKFSWAPLGLVNVVFRVGEVDYGMLTSGAVTVRAVQDVFSLPDAVYVAVQPTGWVPPSSTPTIPANRRLMEATYRDLALIFSVGDLTALPSTAAYVVAMASSPGGLALNYELWTRTGSNAFADVTNGDWTPTATIQGSMTASPSNAAVTLLFGINLDQVEVGTAALIYDGSASEIVRVEAIDPIAGTATLARGCVDTIPAAHSAGVRIWFYELQSGPDPTEWASGETIDAKILTHTSSAVLDISTAPTDSIAVVGREALPYVPQGLIINGVAAASQTLITGPLVVSYFRRNKVTQLDQLIAATAADIPQEAGTTYSIALKDGGGSTFATFTGITAASWTWPTPDDTHTAVGVQVSAANAVGSSINSLTVAAIQRYGWGLRWDSDWGGG